MWASGKCVALHPPRRHPLQRNCNTGIGWQQMTTDSLHGLTGTP